MITSLHAIFFLVFSNVYFVIVILNIYGRKEQFSASTQFSISEKLIFGHFEVNFFNL